jgi:hypothetical protein
MIRCIAASWKLKICHGVDRNENTCERKKREERKHRWMMIVEKVVREMNVGTKQNRTSFRPPSNKLLWLLLLLLLLLLLWTTVQQYYQYEYCMMYIIVYWCQ